VPCADAVDSRAGNTTRLPLEDTWAATAFGLTLRGSLRLESVVASADARKADTILERAPRAALDVRWRSVRPAKLLERRFGDGRVAFSVEHDDDAGFRIWAPRHGDRKSVV